MSFSLERTTPSTRLSQIDVNSAKRMQSMDDQNSWSSTKSSFSPNLQPPTPPIVATNSNSRVCLPSSFGNKYVLVEQFETSNLFRCIDIKTNDEFCCKVCIHL